MALLADTPPSEAVSQIASVVQGAYPGVDAAILATDAPAAFSFAASITRKHGTMVLVGQPDKGITLSYGDVIFRDIHLVGSLIADRDQAEELLALVAEKNVQVQIKEWRPEQAEEMRAEYLTGKGDGKNVILFD